MWPNQFKIRPDPQIRHDRWIAKRVRQATEAAIYELRKDVRSDVLGYLEQIPGMLHKANATMYPKVSLNPDLTVTLTFNRQRPRRILELHVYGPHNLTATQYLDDGHTFVRTRLDGATEADIADLTRLMKWLKEPVSSN